MRIEADREVCTSAGMCALTAPDWFDQDDRDGRVIVLAQPGEPSGAAGIGDRSSVIERAAELCPSGAITLH